MKIQQKPSTGNRNSWHDVTGMGHEAIVPYSDGCMVHTTIGTVNRSYDVCITFTSEELLEMLNGHVTSLNKLKENLSISLSKLKEA